MKIADTQVLFDLETMGMNRATAPIISIGAVKFNIQDGITDKFKVNISLRDQIEKYGRVPEEGTVQWWGEQSEEARNSWLLNTKPTKEALSEFESFYGKSPVLTWSNGTDFDMPLLDGLFQQVLNKSVPWKYWHQCDYRTVLTLYNYDNRAVRKLQEQQGGLVYHDALHDCIGQTEFLLNILRAIHNE